MIKSFAHKGLEKFFKTGSKSGIQATHESRLSAQLAKLDSAKSPQDMKLPAWRASPQRHAERVLGGICARQLALNLPIRWARC